MRACRSASGWGAAWWGARHGMRPSTGRGGPRPTGRARGGEGGTCRGARPADRGGDPCRRGGGLIRDGAGAAGRARRLAEADGMGAVPGLGGEGARRRGGGGGLGGRGGAGTGTRGRSGNARSGHGALTGRHGSGPAGAVGWRSPGGLPGAAAGSITPTGEPGRPRRRTFRRRPVPPVRGDECGAGPASGPALRAAPCFVVRRGSSALPSGRGEGAVYEALGGLLGRRSACGWIAFACARAHVRAVRSCGALRPCRSGSGRTRRPDVPDGRIGTPGGRLRTGGEVNAMRDRGRAGTLCGATLAVTVKMHGAEAAQTWRGLAIARALSTGPGCPYSKRATERTTDGSLTGRTAPAPARASLCAPMSAWMRIPVKPITRSGMKPITESGQGDHQSERSDAGR